MLHECAGVICTPTPECTHINTIVFSNNTRLHCYEDTGCGELSEPEKQLAQTSCWLPL